MARMAVQLRKTKTLGQESIVDLVNTSLLNTEVVGTALHLSTVPISTSPDVIEDDGLTWTRSNDPAILDAPPIMLSVRDVVKLRLGSPVCSSAAIVPPRLLQFDTSYILNVQEKSFLG